MTKINVNSDSLEAAIMDALLSDGENIKSVIIESRDVDNYSQLTVANLTYFNGWSIRVSILIYADGSYFTPIDWKSLMPQSMAGVKYFKWQIGVTGHEAKKLHGKPFVLHQ